MAYTIQVGGQALPVEVQKGRRGRTSLAFDAHARLVVHTGSGTLQPEDLHFLQVQERWILKHFRLFSSFREARSQFEARLETELPLLGNPTPLRLLPAAATSFHFLRDNHFEIKAPQRLLEQHRRVVIYHALKAFAARWLSKRMDHWTQVCQVQPERVRIKDVRSKWGSCSSKRNINLNYHLILVPEPLIDYVLVHELMHLFEMNHGPAFWKRVEQYIPDYRSRKQQLILHQWLIGILNSGT